MVASDTQPGSGKSYVSEENVESVEKSGAIFEARDHPFEKIHTAPFNGCCGSPILIGDDVIVTVVASHLSKLQPPALHTCGLKKAPCFPHDTQTTGPVSSALTTAAEAT